MKIQIFSEWCEFMVRWLQRSFIVMELIQDMALVEAYRFLFHKNYGKLVVGKCNRRNDIRL
jgi:hypothetical protein